MKRALFAIAWLTVGCLRAPASESGQDEAVSRAPPAGTVPRERALERERPAPAITLALLEKGRHRYDSVCATCHGLTGEADTLAAQGFTRRPVPPLHEPKLKEKSDDRVFEVITLGSGAMPAFPEIPADERWAVVGYVRALQLSQRARLEDAPPEMQARLKAEAGR
ncbi:MAG: cytochrome c [Archangiaceae bacterium]|nr:cytochrome c [Archangiaceae bacterium]